MPTSTEEQQLSQLSSTCTAYKFTVLQQTAQNLLARVVKNSVQSSSHALLQQLHRLPVECHVNFETSIYILFIPLSLLTYFLLCMLINELSCKVSTVINRDHASQLAPNFVRIIYTYYR